MAGRLCVFGENCILDVILNQHVKTSYAIYGCVIIYFIQSGGICINSITVIVQSLSCVRLCDPMDCRKPGFPVLRHLRSLFKLMSITSVMPSIHLILRHPLLLLPSIFPSIRVFSKEPALCIRWPKDWSLSFSFIGLSNEYSGLISF